MGLGLAGGDCPLNVFEKNKHTKRRCLKKSVTSGGRAYTSGIPRTEVFGTTIVPEAEYEQNQYIKRRYLKKSDTSGPLEVSEKIRYRKRRYLENSDTSGPLEVSEKIRYLKRRYLKKSDTSIRYWTPQQVNVRPTEV